MKTAGRCKRQAGGVDLNSGLRRSTWCVYLVRCENGALYTGIATDVSRRFAEHQHGESRGAKYLRGKRPLRLVYERAIGSRGLAMRVEAEIKKLPKERKEQLIRQDRMIESMIARARRRSARDAGSRKDGDAAGVQARPTTYVT